LILIGAFMDPPVRYAESALQAKMPVPLARPPEPITVGLNAAILAVRGDEALVAVVPAARPQREGDGALPCGAFSPRQHKTLEEGVRYWVRQQTGIELAATRQIGTLSDCQAAEAGPLPPSLSIVAVCYEALISPAQFVERAGTAWHSWYAYFPWEDWRRGKPRCLVEAIEPRLEVWARLAHDDGERMRPQDALDRRQRLAIAFGWDGMGWDEESVLERYELLCEAGLAGDSAEDADAAVAATLRLPRLTHPMLGDQARVLAAAIGELRRSVKCRPVIFELMPEAFTLFELQKAVEAILGPHLHKQNFRRLVEGGGLVEPTGEFRLRTGGRPARLYRFRRDVLLERLAPGVRIKAARA
jgi:hypothetical protein